VLASRFGFVLALFASKTRALGSREDRSGRLSGQDRPAVSRLAALHKTVLLNSLANQLLSTTRVIENARRMRRMAIFALCLAFGVLLAQTFRVFIVAPATLLVVLLGATGDIAAESLWARLLSFAAATTALQAGYLIGMSRWIIVDRGKTIDEMKRRFDRRAPRPNWYRSQKSGILGSHQFADPKNGATPPEQH
jgi:hypothetical protein